MSLPPYVVPRIEAVSMKVEHQVAIWGVYIQQGEGDMKLAKVSWMALIGAVKARLDVSKVQIEEAKKMLID